RVELGESAVEELERKLADAAAHISERPEISVTYFVPDARKEGGAYMTRTGALKRIDELERALVFADGAKIAVGDIISVET
ncbi:MAG TPA: hypothetical protein IAC18_01000, partial [Candidatus Scatomorpha merdipullorum]|nr:hypothetical protein [Candidatus Scatomorpha merdipullorum]